MSKAPQRQLRCWTPEHRPYSAVSAIVGLGSDHVIGYVLDDGLVVTDPSDNITTGVGVELVVNTGEDPHTLVVTGDTGEVIIATDLIAPGTSVELELDLKSDIYWLTCRIVTQTEDGTLIDHFQKGMHTKIEGRA